MKTTGIKRTKSISLALALMGGVAAGGLVLSPLGSKVADAKPIVVKAPVGAPMSFADLIDRVSPAVVSVQVVTEVETPEQYGELFDRFRNMPGLDDFFENYGPPGAEDEEGEEGDGENEGPATREGRSLGSGFFISESGHIVTNNHVVENASEVTVTLSNGDELEAEIIGLDEATDLAVLKVKKKGSYPYVNFALEANPRVGDWVVAVGNPFGLGGTATAGIVSANGREIGGSNYSDFIQIDASINRGNSGGPTFNLYGQVIGVNTAIFSPSGGSVGIGFAIEASVAKKITDLLIKDGKVTRGWLGVSIHSLSPEFVDSLGLENDEGAFVADVQKDSPADKSGIKMRDVILSVNEIPIKNSRELTRIVGGLLAGSKNEFKVWRDGKVRTVSVEIGVRPGDVNAAFERGSSEEEFGEDSSSSENTTELYGLSVRPLGDAEREYMGLDEAESGLFIEDLERSSPFAEARIAKSDALLEAQGTTLKSAGDLEAVVNKAKKEGKNNILVTVRRARTTSFVAVEIKDLK